jgi:MFS family permease
MGRVPGAAAAQDVERRNFWLNAVEGALYSSSGAFITQATVLPALILRLGGDALAVGGISVITWAGLFLPQLLASRVVETLPWKKPYAIRFGALQRFALLSIGVALFFLGDAPPALSVTLVLALYALNQIVLGLATPGWFDMFAKLTPPNQRGRLVGIRSAMGGVGSFIGGSVLTALLTYVAFPHSYAYAFLCAFLLQFVSVLVQFALVETEASPVRPPRPLPVYLRHVTDVVRTNHDFRAFLTAAGLMVLASIPLGFFMAYGLARFGMPESAVGEFTLVMVGAQIVTAPVVGLVADRKGNRVALAVAGTAMMLATLTAILAPTSGWFRLVFALVGVHLGTDLLSRYNMSIEFGPPEQRSTYIGLMNTALSPLYLSGLAGGWAAGTFGFVPVFVAGLCCSVAGLTVLALYVNDPRVGAHAVLRPPREGRP